MSAALVLTVTLDGQAPFQVRSRPGDFVRVTDRFGKNWADDTPEMTVATFLAYLGTRRTGYTGSWDDFLDVLVELDVVEEELRPFDGAPGNGSPSSSPSPQAPPLPNGSTPTYEFS
jgi:hypothetical protein